MSIDSGPNSAARRGRLIVLPLRAIRIRPSKGETASASGLAVAILARRSAAASLYGLFSLGDGFLGGFIAGLQKEVDSVYQLQPDDGLKDLPAIKSCVRDLKRGHR